MELGVTLRQGMDQRLLLLPKMLQAIELLQLSTQDLMLRIDAELASNETLELTPPADEPAESRVDESAQRYDDVDDYGRGGNRQFDERDDPIQRIAAPSLSLQDHLLRQLSEVDVSPAVRTVAEFLVGSLDTNGHLPLTSDELRTIFSGEPETAVDEALALVQSFEPVGVAQPGPRESMLYQLDPGHPSYASLDRLVREQLEDLAANRWPKVARSMGITLEDLRELSKSLRDLDPCPGRSFATDDATPLRADVVVRREDGEWQIYVDDARVPPLRVQPHYESIASDASTSRDVRSYLRDKIASARELLFAIEQRRETLGRVARATLERQHRFLERGLAGLAPLGMQEVADAVGVHLSTVSRAIAGKYVQTDYGVFPMRRLFDGGKGVGADAKGRGGDSRSSVQQRIRALVEGENAAHPLSDEQLVDALARQGVEVARRTVAKYRKELGIPSSFRRRSH